MLRRGGRDERVVYRATRDSARGQRQHELAMGTRSEAQERAAGASSKEARYHLTGGPVWRREPGQHRVSFERTVPDDPSTCVEHATRGFVFLVPRREGRNQEAGVRGDHRRTRSNVSRT